MNNNTSVMNIHDSTVPVTVCALSRWQKVNLLLREERLSWAKLCNFIYINVAFAHHGYIKNTVKTVILWNIIAI